MQNEIVDSRSFYEIFLASAIRTCFPKLILMHSNGSHTVLAKCFFTLEEKSGHSQPNPPPPPKKVKFSVIFC